nr:TIGR02530 family flagellar biosynthesis protein [Lentibacillus sp. JNUCC-1]
MPLPNTGKQVVHNPKTTQFKDVLSDQLDLKISKHAEERMKERQINLSDHEWQLMTDKMKEAKQKGVTDSLVLTKDAALIVSNKNNTVVTVMNKEEASSKLITNINGAILLNH